MNDQRILQLEEMVRAGRKAQAELEELLGVRDAAVIDEKIMCLLSELEEATTGIIVNRCRKWPRAVVVGRIQVMQIRRLICERVDVHAGNGLTVSYWSADR